MVFLKVNLGRILIIFSYIMIFLISIGVLITYDNSQLTYINYHKIIYLLNCILVILCHIQSSITNPGIITHENNLRVIELYISTHQHCIQNADSYNKKFKDMLEEEKDEGEYVTEDDNFDFGHSYSVKTNIRDAAIVEISKEYKVKLTRCRKCLVVRVPNAHHCTKCKGCVLKYDHHCYWINNCLGIFNKKHIILFSYYCMIATFHAMTIFSYYMIKKNNKM